MNVMQRGWYYRASGRECGPVPFERLAELVRHHRLLPADEILKGPAGTWIKISDCEELSSILDIHHLKTTKNAPLEKPTETAQTRALTSPSPNETVDQPQGERLWYYKLREEERDPYQASELQRRLSDGTLIPLDLVRRGTLGAWKEYFRCEPQIASDAAIESQSPRETEIQVTTDAAPGEASGKKTSIETPVAAKSPDVPASNKPKISPVLHRRSRKKSYSLVERFRANAREHWPLLAAGVLLVVANLCALYYSPTDPNRERHRIFSEFLVRMKSLQSQNASQEAWEQISQEAERTIRPIVEELKKRATCITRSNSIFSGPGKIICSHWWTITGRSPSIRIVVHVR